MPLQLNNDQKMRVVQMLERGSTEREVARLFGVTKNTVHGIKRRYHNQHEPTTLEMRVDALNTKMDRILEETGRAINQYRAEAQ